MSGDGAESESGAHHPPLDRFDCTRLPRPADGILYLYVSDVDGFWHIEVDEDIALQEATGYPVGELAEYEQMGDCEESERGEVRALFVGPDRRDSLRPTCDADGCDATVAGPADGVSTDAGLVCHDCIQELIA